MSANAGAKGIREGARELVLRAAEAGMERPWELLARTPAEIEAELRVLNARKEQQLQQLDLLAWLTGRYVLIGMHAPRRYPRRPDGLRQHRSPMSDTQMKQVFAALAARRRDEVGSG